MDALRIDTKKKLRWQNTMLIFLVDHEEKKNSVRLLSMSNDTFLCCRKSDAFSVSWRGVVGAVASGVKFAFKGI